MKFAGYIALGQFSDEELEDFRGSTLPDRRVLSDSNRLPGIRLGLLLSVVVHIALAAFAIASLSSESTVTPMADESILRVNLIRRMPPQQVALEAEEEVVAVAGNEVPPSEENSLERVAASPLVPTEQSQSSAGSIAAQEESKSESVNPNTTNAERASRDVEIVSIPDSSSVRSAIVAVRQQQDPAYQLENCNKLDEEKVFNNCSPNDVRDYSSLTFNPVYESYSPGSVSDGRSRAVTLIAGQSGALVQGLSTGKVMPGLSAYVLEELEQGIELRSNSKNRTINHMNTMQDKSAAGEMSRRLFDPWVRQNLQELEDRRVK